MSWLLAVPIFESEPQFNGEPIGRPGALTPQLCFAKISLPTGRLISTVSHRSCPAMDSDCGTSSWWLGSFDALPPWLPVGIGP